MQIQHVLPLRKGQGFTHQTADALTQSIIQTLNVRGVSCLFAYLLMGGRRQTRIGPPEIAVAHATLITRWQFAPQAPTRCSAAIADEKRENLPRPPTLNNPNATLVFLHLHKGEEFIHL